MQKTFLSQITKDHNLNDYISGERIQVLCDFSYEIGKLLPEYNCIIYCCGDDIDSFLNEASKEQYKNNKYVLVTHNSDVNITQSHLDRLPANIIRWLGQNMNVVDPMNRLDCIPIGLANAKWPHGNITDITNLDPMWGGEVYATYLCIKIETNPKERIPWYNFAVNNNGKVDNWPIPRKQFLEGIRDSLFTLCPPGNGVDSHRVWETLYMGRIPIVKKTVWCHYFRDLPIVCVDRPEDITHDLLQWSTGLFNYPFDFSKLFINYWQRYLKVLKESLE